MATWATVDHYYSGQGVVMAAERDAQGNPKGFVGFGNVSALSIAVATSVMEHKESHSGQRGTDKRLTTETTVTLSMTVENFVARNLASALRGTDNQIEAGTVVAEKIGVYLGKVVGFKFINVSDVVVTREAAALTPYVDADTPFDYEVNLEAGSIRFNDGVATPLAILTSVDEGKEATVAYSYTAQARVDALTEGVKELYLRFEGLNTAEGNSPVIVDVFKFNTDPLRELSLIGDGIQQFVLEGSVLADTTKNVGSKYFNTKQLI